MNIRDRVFLVIGTAFLGRQRAVDNLKKRILKQRSAAFNIVTFYPREIELKDLRHKMLTYSLDKEKIIIFKDAYNLSVKVRDFLFTNLKQIIAANYIILEIDITGKDLVLLANEYRVCQIHAADPLTACIGRTFTPSE